MKEKSVMESEGTPSSNYLLPRLAGGVTALGRHRILSAWLVWALAMMTNALVGVLIQSHLIRNNVRSGPVLYDMGFELLPYVSSKSVGFSIPDLCSILSATFIAVNLVLTFPPSDTVIILRRILCIAAVAYFGRAISVVQTLLPNPDGDCTPVLHPMGIVMSVLSVPFGGSITCADCFYSGHAIPISCALLTWSDYMRRNPFWRVGICVSVLALSGIVITHFHYTVDVFYGFIVTFITWRIYHFILSCPSAFQHYWIVSWWEREDGVGPDGFKKKAGVFALDLSSDPRVTWSMRESRAVKAKYAISGKQCLILGVVLVTLLPTWINVWANKTEGPGFRIDF